MEDREKIREALTVLLRLGCGFEVGLFTMLEIYQLEDRRYVVHNNDMHGESFDNSFQTTDDSMGYNEGEDACEEIYEDLDTAVDRFLQLREIRELGFDIEKDYFDQEYGDQNDE